MALKSLISTLRSPKNHENEKHNQMEKTQAANKSINLKAAKTILNSDE